MHCVYRNFLIVLIFAIVNNVDSQGELFTSYSHMTSLVHAEIQITEILRDYLVYHAEALEKARMYVKRRSFFILLTENKKSFKALLCLFKGC